MNVNSSNDRNFLTHLTEITEANLHNEQFGVSELSREIGKSRAHIHRYIKAVKNQSISQFIRSVRLNKALEMLQDGEDSASEVAYKVGFGSPAYFNHCFHDHFGYPPGEVKRRLLSESGEEHELHHDSETESNLLQANGGDKLKTGKKLTLKKIILRTAAVLFLFAVIWTLIHFFVDENAPLKIFNNQPKELSIIVLPFKNFSENPSDQYFADGIMEDVLNNLFRITALRVVSRTSADKYRESNLTVHEIANEMNVNYVLEGSVRRYGDKTRISVQLIDTKKDQHVWSANFDRQLTDIMGVQGEIALQIAQNLDAVISEMEVSQIEERPTQNHEAYDYYLRARFLLHKANSQQRSGFDKQGVTNCIQYYEKAIVADSTFAEAYAGLANAWMNLSAWGWLPGGFQKARDLCKKALQIDSGCAEAHAVLGAYYIWFERKIEQGGKELQMSIRLNPNFSTAQQWYAQYLMITGPIEEARVHVNRALELEPYFWVVQNLSSWIYYFEEKYDKALGDCIIARDLKPDFIDNKWLFVLNYAKLGEGEKMANELQSIATQYSGSDEYAAEIMAIYKQVGINGLFSWLIDINKNNPIPVEGMNGHPFFIAWWNAIIGNKDEAVYWLEKVMDEKRIPYHYFNLIATNPDFDILRDDPRFLKVVDKIGLTPYHNRKAK